MISVIVPAYNVEDYIEVTIRSILNSTYSDFELIIVDDGSTDRTAELCDGWALSDKRISVIHQANTGVVGARNKGLHASRGDFITFVDSDDVIHPAMLDVLIGAISAGDYDMSMVLNKKIEEDERERYLNCRIDGHGDCKPLVLSQEDYISLLFRDRMGFYAGPWHKLFRRELLLGGTKDFLEFKPIPAEDTEWLIRVCSRLSKCIVVPLELYFYVMRSSSLTHAQSQRGVNAVIVGRLQTVFSFLDLFPEDKPQYKTMCLNDLYRRIHTYTYLARGTDYQDELRARCKEIYKKTIKEYLNSPVGIKAKVKNVVYYHCPWVFRSVVSLSELLAKCKTRCSISK